MFLINSLFTVDVSRYLNAQYVALIDDVSRTPSAIEVDPDGRGFVVGPDGQAYQLVKGWQYVLGVFVR